MTAGPTPPAKPLFTNFRLIFGVFLPVVCVEFDPFVFQRDAYPMNGYGLLENYRIACWFAIAAGVLAMAVALFGSAGSPRLQAFLGGFLIIASLFSGLIGIVLLPMSVIGLFALIGAFGFTPIFSAIACMKTARHLLATASSALPRPRVRKLALIGAFALAIPPLAIQAWVEVESGRLVHQLRSEDPAVVERAMSDIERWGFFRSAACVYEAAIGEPEGRVRDNLARGAEALGARFTSD
jgi:hypothetical protein